MNKLLLLLSNYMKYNIFYLESKLIGYYSDIEGSCHYSSRIPPFSKIIIYGFGPYGEFAFVDLFNKQKILGIYDQKFENFGTNVKSPDFINENEFDYIIITVLNENARKSVTEFLMNKGIKQEKMIYVNLNE